MKDNPKQNNTKIDGVAVANAIRARANKVRVRIEEERTQATYGEGVLGGYSDAILILSEQAPDKATAQAILGLQP